MTDTIEADPRTPAAPDVTRVLANNSTAVAGRMWRSGVQYDVPDTEIDALRPHISAGVFSLVGDVEAAFVEQPDPSIPDFIAGSNPDADDQGGATSQDPGQAGVDQAEADRRGVGVDGGD